MNLYYSRSEADLDKLMVARQRWQQSSKVVVWTNGCFDIIHAGHMRSLKAARALGDFLVVGVNSDSSVRLLKGPTRPIVPEQERAELLVALRCVDAVLIFDEATPELALGRLKPDIHCKGADYAPPNGKPIPERALVESYGGQVRFLPILEGVSTTEIVERIRRQS